MLIWRDYMIKKQKQNDEKTIWENHKDRRYREINERYRKKYKRDRR